MKQNIADKKTGLVPIIDLDDFFYDLPVERIAEYPLAERSSSKLLFADVSNNSITHHKFSDLPGLLPENSLLIVNNTKVISARLQFRKETGGSVELLCVDPLEPSGDHQITMATQKSCTWRCIVGGKKVKPGLMLQTTKGNLKAWIIERLENEAIVEFSWVPENKSFSEILELNGSTPLPPYIKREAEPEDKIRYQTVYAESDGSVAAPTAGLHFTNIILEEIKKKNILIEEVTLHVGPGTFKPIETNDISQHTMHREMISVSEKTIKAILHFLKNRKEGSKIIATGTTSLRTMETLYWYGIKVMREDFEEFFLEQWEPYQYEKESETASLIDSLTNLLNWMNKQNKSFINGSTQLFIVPGYKFKIVDALITNYHIPKSTLILLVAAFAGKTFRKQIYDTALANEYRFLSYGDSSLIFR